MDDDFALALQLQSELFEEDSNQAFNTGIIENVSSQGSGPVSLVDPYWEMTDPNPDIRALFLQFNDRFFWGQLCGIEVKWSPRMTLCAGLCCYEGRGGLCSVRLSVPLLQLRPRKDLVETLLHEMIHAYLFVTDNNKDHDGHGPEFHKHMYRINSEAGTSISVYHNFHDEVEACRQHWWRCDGPCRSRKPYFGYVKRSMNRAPSKNDTWWNEHQRTCGGTYTKVKEPEGFGKKKSKKKDKDEKGINDSNTSEKNKKEVSGKSGVKSMDIRIFGGTGKTLNGTSKPTATITKPPDEMIRPKNIPKTSSFQKDSPKFSNKSDPTLPVLSGAVTPEKKTLGVKNKPVSQGGSATMGKKQLLIFDFSDTDDSDDELLGAMSLDNVGGVSHSQDDTQGKEAPHILEDGNTDVITLHDISGSSDIFSSSKSEIISEEISAKADDTLKKTESYDSDQKSDSDAGDVRAMLRKVWGSKQFGGQVNKKIKPRSVFSDGSTNTSLKRLSDETSKGSEQFKRPRISGLGDETRSTTSVHKTVTQDTKLKDISTSPRKYDSPSTSGNCSDKGSKQTSPIEKMFNRIKSKQTGESSSNPNARETTNTRSAADVSSCPICSKEVPLSTINDHLDLCLTLQAIS